MKVVSLLMLMVLGCSKAGGPASTNPAQAAVPAEAAPAPAAAGPKVTFPDGFVVRVEVVADDASRAEGLMWRDQLLPGTGMLFIFQADGEYPFWMKNTKIPLDMIWITADQRVAAVKYRVPPCEVENCPTYAPNAISRYVLEVAGGVAEEHGLKAGDAVKIEDLGNVQVR